MIKDKTVLVLGAGASMHCGFPLGRDLLFTICDYLGSQSYERRFIQETYSKTDKEIDAFVNELRGSHLPSVDAFLENRPEHHEIGKAAIALMLIPCERAENLIRQSDKFDWYEYLYQKMGSTPASFVMSAGRISFITFNYDRSLEYFFYYSLVNSYGPEKATELYEVINIIHVYGQLGEPSFLTVDGRDYDATPTREAVAKCISAVRIMPERSEDSEEFRRAHKFISVADILCFLGFGYEETNLGRLRINDIFKGSRLLGCVYKLGANEILHLLRYFEPTVSRRSSPNFFDLQNCSSFEDALAFLRNRPVFEC